MGSTPTYIHRYGGGSSSSQIEEADDGAFSAAASPTTPRSAQLPLADAERLPLLGHAPPTSGVSNTLKLLFFICGVSTFARSESILMQTQMYANCFGLGPRFYPAASSALFMPGIVVQLIQNRYDKTFDRKFTTFRAANARLLLSIFCSLSTLAMMLIAAYYSPTTRSNGIFIYSMLGLVGVGISISFGSFVQIVTMFPSALHPFFFMGTYAPFFIFAPINIAVKDLCEPVERMGQKGMWLIRWNSVFVYYIVASVMTLAGLASFYGIAHHPFGKRTFRHKDEELATLNISDTASVKVRQSLNLDDADRTSLLSARTSSVSDESSVELDAPLTSLEVLRHIWREVLAQSLVTIISTIVAALYIDVRPTRFMDLPTILIYNYYICASVGTVLTSWDRFCRLFTPNRLIFFAAIRVVFIPLAILYNLEIITYHNDYLVIGMNSLHMLVGGTIFSLSFSMAASKFRAKPVRSAASTMMNVSYYLAMAVGMGISFGLNK